MTVNAKKNNSLPNFFKNMGPLFGMDRNTNKTQRDKNIERESVRMYEMCVNTDSLDRRVAIIT